MFQVGERCSSGAPSFYKFGVCRICPPFFLQPLALMQLQLDSVPAIPTSIGLMILDLYQTVKLRNQAPPSYFMVLTESATGEFLLRTPSQLIRPAQTSPPLPTAEQRPRALAALGAQQHSLKHWVLHWLSEQAEMYNRP